VRFAIADPPYLGRAARHYGPGASSVTQFGSGPARAARGWAPSLRATTEHPDAHEWDDPARHTALVAELLEGYDGFAIAAWPTSLPTYLAALPADARVGVWVKPQAVPSGSRVLTGWEPVLFYVPPTRRPRGTGESVRDVLTAPFPRPAAGVAHVGRKPRAWTRWVLDVLGARDEDEVVDLFPGSGAVGLETAQLVLGGNGDPLT